MQSPPREVLSAQPRTICTTSPFCTLAYPTYNDPDLHELYAVVRKVDAPPGSILHHVRRLEPGELGQVPKRAPEQEPDHEDGDSHPADVEHGHAHAEQGERQRRHEQGDQVERD